MEQNTAAQKSEICLEERSDEKLRKENLCRNRRLSAEDIDALIDLAEDDRVRRLLQTIKEEKIRTSSNSNLSLWRKSFLSIPIYNNSIAIIFILTILSFSISFLLKYTTINIPVDITQPALVVIFAFSAIMFHKYVSDKEEIVGMVDELAGYSIENESIFENIGNGLIVVDAMGKVTKVNRKAESILGAKNSELVSKDCLTAFNNQELAEFLIQTLRTGNPINNYSIELENNGGDQYSLQITTSLLSNKKGHTIGAVEVINDITEIRNLQEKLKLNEHLASIGELSAKLGHEIGNSLGGIKLFTDNLLEELPVNDNRYGYAEEILSEVDHLKALVSNLKDYSRPLNLELRKTDINEVAETVISISREQIQKNMIKVDKHLDYDLPKVNIDQDQIKCALLNIVINAIQAMPEGGKLNISTIQRGNSMEISVNDTGIGIPEENQGKIFNPFFTTKKVLGTGLGLSIAYKTIKSHSGNIRFNSEVNVGTTFTIDLPLETSMEQERQEIAV
ncbi:PAS domain S-box protein [Candidatus Poribacteria bacterium]|nr:PAS domain S-box protein [Candidatus Poribacteria bacterium]